MIDQNELYQLYLPDIHTLQTFIKKMVLDERESGQGIAAIAASEFRRNTCAWARIAFDLHTGLLTFIVQHFR